MTNRACIYNLAIDASNVEDDQAYYMPQKEGICPL